MILLLAACSGKKSKVLSQEDMAQLMADIHMAEGMVDVNYSDFHTDSDRLALRMSIYEAHGVTREQVDSSFEWYGHHIEDYIKVYDRTIEILESRQSTLLAKATEKITAEGDSVDIWPYSPHFEISRRAPSGIITFDIEADSNWHDADVMRLKYKMVKTTEPVLARIVIEYADGTSFFNYVIGNTTGFNNIDVRVDSLRGPVRVAGYMMATPKADETVIIDSISLVKMRGFLSTRYVGQRPFDYNIKSKEEQEEQTTVNNDTLPSDGSMPAFDSKPIKATAPGAHQAPQQVWRTTSPIKRAGNNRR